MKRGFTLVEMLIVVVVLVTLMSITFRLSSIGSDQTRRNQTIARMQRIENCLSGYYACFGTYPPVRLHGSHDYNLEANSHGIQTDTERPLDLSWYTESGDHGIYTDAAYHDWMQVRAACRAQPLAARFPAAKGYDEYIQAQCELAKERVAENPDDYSSEQKSKISAGYDDGWTRNPGRFDFNEDNWQEVQLFEFGVMSFLVPRYLYMMNGPEEFFRSAQWTGNNQLPANPLRGSNFGGWYQLKTIYDEIQNNNQQLSRFQLMSIPSQAVCARWLANLEGICHCQYMLNTKFFGVDIDGEVDYDSEAEIFSPGGSSSDSTSDQYVLGHIDVPDGWRNSFYYYSPPPYQSYTLWSSGPNGRTFPPWVDRTTFSSAKNRAIGVWIDDDIIHMSN